MYSYQVNQPCTFIAACAAHRDKKRAPNTVMLRYFATSGPSRRLFRFELSLALESY
jgi:hypothetical protein